VEVAMGNRISETEFWSRFNKTDTCWLWTKGTTSNGYGEITYIRDKWHAHTLAYHFSKGAIPKGMVVMHTCDVKACGNPEHLVLGTQADNIADMVAKGRNHKPKGSSHPNSRLNDDLVRLIRADPRSAGEIAREYKIAQTQISRIKRRTSWAHVE
jgi:hypothetical protein